MTEHPFATRFPRAESLRDVIVDERWRLQTWDANQRGGSGKEQVIYRFSDRDGTAIFENVLGASPLHAVDADQTLRAIMNFVSLRPGDTDAEFFDDYTPEQLAFADEHGEYLAMYGMDDGGDFTPPPFVDYEETAPQLAALDELPDTAPAVAAEARQRGQTPPGHTLDS